MNLHQRTSQLAQLRLLKWTIPKTTRGRRALNILLLSVVLPSLLLGLASVFIFTAFPLSSVMGDGRSNVFIGHVSEPSIQPVSYSGLSNFGAAQGLPSPGLTVPAVGNLATGVVAPVLAVVAVVLAALAGGVILWSNRQARVQPPSGDSPVPEQLTSQSSDRSELVPQEVSQRLVAIQESVRRDMADYLHGHVQSKLLALSMSLSTCQKLLARDPAHAYHLLERIQTELQRVQDEDLRQVSRELYPAIIKMGLVPAIRSLTSRFSDLLEIDLIIDADIFALDAAGEAKLPEKQRLGIYRIAEEALNNVLKHAKASHAEVNLICDFSDQLVLSVIDDGRGFDPLVANNSQGLVMMSDYAEAIGGKADISSSPGQGTTIKLVIPLKSDLPDTVVMVGTNLLRFSKAF